MLKTGISQVPEGRRIFANIGGVENLELGAFTRSDKAGIASDLKMVFARFLDSKNASHKMQETLSGGEQQMLAMGRALMSRLDSCFWMNLQWGLRHY